MSVLKVGPPEFSPRLVVFDKDGTLIDFDFMWASWALALARSLERLSARQIASALFQAYGYDPAEDRVIPGLPLAIDPVSSLYRIASTVLIESGLPAEEVRKILEAGWFVPDPVRSARPLSDLPRLFSNLRAKGIKIAVATTDDREPTESTLAALGAGQYVDCVMGGDDISNNKPAPDMFLKICEMLAVQPANAVMIGDSVADLEMGRQAGAALNIGVLSGVSSAEILAPYADALIRDVGALL